MSETASTLIKGALRLIGAIATGETPSDDEMQDEPGALSLMLRNWSMSQIRLYFQTQDTVSLTGASYYTIGSGGTVNTTRPDFIIGGYVRDAQGFDSPIKVIDADKYRKVRIKTTTGTIEYVWYNPEYPLGKIYVFPVSGSTLYLDSMKPLVDPTAITSSIAFPPGYDEAIKLIVVRYAERNVERSVWLNGEKYIAGKTAMASIGLVQAKMVLIGFRTQNRAQTHGTYKFLFKALVRQPR